MPPKSKPKSKPEAQPSKACVFCYSEEENEEAYGKMLRKAGITIHYFCMLFSSGLWQRGKRDQDGILGFLPADIRREQKRGQRLTCQYCKRRGATIGCCVSSCRKTFHFRCGREAGGMSQFFQEFRSYCPEHRPRQVTPTSASDRLAFYGTAKSTCSICMLAVEARSSNDTLRSPCCRNAWFHRDCIQRYAVTAGAYFFKCPLCNNKDLFEAEMLQFGIYIPEQDAAWEQEPNAFQELLERYSRCDAEKCLCPQGREHDGSAGTRWELLLCMWCGSSGTHFGCRGFTKVGKDSVCSECFEINAILEREKKKKKCSKSSSPQQTTPSLQEIRRQLQQRRSASSRAQRITQQEGSPPSEPGDQQPSSSERMLRILRRQRNQASITAFSPLSLHTEDTRVVSPSLLKDRRLTASIPVVRVERADSEVEVNVTDSDDEEVSGASLGESQESGCARQRGLPDPSSARLHDQPRQAAGTWDVKGVIEKGQRKVVLLSMLNEQDYSSESSMQSTTSAMQTRLQLRSKQHDSETEETDNERVVQGVHSSHRRRGRPRKVQKESGFKEDSENTQTSDTSQKRGPGRPRKNQQQLDKSVQCSFDNDSCSSKSSSVERESLSPAPSTSKTSSRRTRSVTLHCQKRASDSSSEERDCDVSLAQLGIKRRRVTRRQGKVESEKRRTETKGKSQCEYQSGSPGSSTSAESLTTKVRYRRALQRALRSSQQGNKLGSDDNAESYDSDSKSKSHLSTDVRGLQSTTLAMTTDSKLGSSFEQGHHTGSTMKMLATGPEQDVRPTAQETERRLGPTEMKHDRGSLKETSDGDPHGLAVPLAESGRTVIAVSGDASQLGTCRLAAASVSNQSTGGAVGSAVSADFHTVQSPVPSSYAQFLVPKPQLKRAGQGVCANTPSAAPLSKQRPLPSPLIAYTEACAGAQPDLAVSAQPCVTVRDPSSTRAHQLGVFAVQLQPQFELQPQSVPATQASVVTMPASQPFPVTMVAAQPHPAGSQAYTITASPSVSFVQWIHSLENCYPSQAERGFFSATHSHAVVVPTTQPPPVTTSCAQPHPAVVTRSLPYLVAIAPAPTHNISATKSDRDPVTQSVMSDHPVSVLPALAPPSALAQALAGECSQRYPVPLTTARPKPVAGRVSEQYPAPVFVTAARPAPVVMSALQSASAVHQQTPVIPASQAAPVPVSLYVTAGNVAPVIESHSVRGGRKVSDNSKVPVPVSLFQSSGLMSAPIPSAIQQPAATGQPLYAASIYSGQAVATSQANTTSWSILRQHLAAPCLTRSDQDPKSAGLLCQTVPPELGNQTTRPAGAQTQAGNQQNRQATPMTATPMVMRPPLSRPAHLGRSQQGGLSASWSTHPVESECRERTASQSSHQKGSQQGGWIASQSTYPKESRQRGWTAGQSSHPEGSQQEWIASQTTHPVGSQQGRWPASQSTHPEGSQQGQIASQPMHPEGSQQGGWTASKSTHPEGIQQRGWVTSQSTHSKGSQQRGLTAIQSSHPEGSQQGQKASQPTHPVGSQQERLTASQSTHPEGSQQGGWITSQSTHSKGSQQQGLTASRSLHPEGSQQGHIASQPTHPEGQQERLTASQSTHPEGSQQGGWITSQSTHSKGSQQQGLTASRSSHPEGSQQGQIASQPTHPEGGQHGKWTASQSTHPEGRQQGGWITSQSTHPAGGQQSRQTSSHSAAAAASQQRTQRDGMSAPQSQSSAPSRGQQVMASILPAAAQPAAGSTEKDKSLPSSRGKIWLSPESMQAQLCKGPEAEVVVLLSDSDDSDAELKITGMSPAQAPVKGTTSSGGHSHARSSHSAGSCQPKPQNVGRAVPNQPAGSPDSGCMPVNQPATPSLRQSSGQSQLPGRNQPKTNPSNTQSTSAPVTQRSTQGPPPVYRRPPCPVHGYNRLVRRRKHPIGSVTIDLTDREPVAKKAHLVEPEVTLSSDSDVEIIG